MLHQLFTLRDNKACVYHGPFKAVNQEVFLRELQTIKGSDSIFGKHPEDFSIYHLGSFDDSTAVVNTSPAVHIINLIDLFGENNV